MSYDLRPRRAEAGPFRFGAYSWGYLLDTGVGLAIGYGPGIRPGTYLYQPDRRGNDPMCNDGFYVTARQARLMAALIEEMLAVERGRWDQWEAMNEAERQEVERRFHRFTMPIRDDWIAMFERFAEWARASGGFWVE